MSRFVPFSQKKHDEWVKNNPPCTKRIMVTTEIAGELQNIGLFVGYYPKDGAISFRDARGNLWEIKIEKSDVAKAAGEL